MVGLNACAYSGRSSPSRKKLKNAVHAVAHTTVLLGSAEERRDPLTLPRVCSVIGSLIFGGAVPLCSLVLLIPTWILFRSGKENCSLGM